MKKLLTALLITLTLTVSANATIIIDGDHTIGLYGVQWEKGASQETRFPEFIALAEAGSDAKIAIENDWLDWTSGATGFIMVANWKEGEKTLTSGIDYAGTTQTYFSDIPISIVNTIEEWQIWWSGYTFSGGTVLNDITKMFAKINYGDYNISEKITRRSSSPVPEPATVLLLGIGLLSLFKISKKKKS